MQTVAQTDEKGPGEPFEWPELLRTTPPPRTISPAARDALAAAAAQTARGGLEAQRALCAAVQETLGAAQRERYRVDMAEGGMGGVPVRIFTPAGGASTDSVLLNLHGGGFTMDAGSVTENVPVAALTGAKIVAVRYRQAPEHPFPAAVDDAEAVYRALLETCPARRIGLYGTSAGAILAVQMLARLKRGDLPMPAALGFFSGTADLGRMGDTEQLFRPALDRARTGSLFADYVGAHDPADPALSPLLGSLDHVPPTLCIAGTRDFLLSQTTLFHRALLAAGVPAELVVFEAMLHAHWIYQDIPESDEAFRLMADFFRRRLAMR
ncbi:MAG TPA: alpha/beta hydrolase fold domain-containing protein [Allosphingosinicella sp.]|nr:alpha/beta hydrolase fold domain-containing protein [Allosphingosinicella sp.]